MKKRVIAVLAVLMLASASPALASDKLPPLDEMSQADLEAIAANGWNMYQQGILDNPCRNDAFRYLYSEWFGCF